MPEGTEQKLIKFVEQGLTDAQIGKLLQRPARIIAYWREKLFTSKGPPIDWAQRFQ